MPEGLLSIEQTLVADVLFPTEYSVPGLSRPKRWEDSVRTVARSLTGKEAVAKRWHYVWEPKAIFVSWGPSVSTLVAGLVGRKVAYLCWGVPRNRGSGPLVALKLLRLRALLRSATVILVNEAVTAKDVEILVGRKPIVIPYVVDSDFYKFVPRNTNADLIVVPGDNDRNEALVLKLAAAGMRVTRVTREPRVSRWYLEYDTSRLVDLRYRIAFTDLRRLYQEAAAILLPLSSNNHPAGQTSLLEAIACGAPVVISEGRISTQVSEYRSVIVCKSKEPLDWCRAVRSASDMAGKNPSILAESSRRVASRHHPAHVEALLKDVLTKA